MSVHLASMNAIITVTTPLALILAAVMMDTLLMKMD